MNFGKSFKVLNHLPEYQNSCGQYCIFCWFWQEHKIGHFQLISTVHKLQSWKWVKWWDMILITCENRCGDSLGGNYDFLYVFQSAYKVSCKIWSTYLIKWFHADLQTNFWICKNLTMIGVKNEAVFKEDNEVWTKLLLSYKARACDFICII